MNEQLRLLLIPTWYPSTDSPVAGVFVQDQARALAIQHDVTVLAPHSTASADVAVEDGVRVLRLPATGNLGRSARAVLELRAVSAAVAQLRTSGWMPDVMHAHVYVAGFSAVIVGRRWRVPVVVSEHHSDIVEGRLSLLASHVARFTYRRADLVCPVSSLLERSIMALEPRATCEVVANVVDLDAFATTRRQEHAPGSRLIAVAGLYRYKGMVDLIDAVRLLVLRRPHVSLRIVGDGPERPALEVRAEGLPITFLGVRTRAEVAGLMRDADALVMPSLVETFGIAAVEALAAGLPVVCTSACGVADVVQAHGGLVVSPSDPHQLSDALDAILERKHGIPATALDELRRTFGSAAIAGRLDAIYRSVLSARRGCGG